MAYQERLSCLADLFWIDFDEYLFMKALGASFKLTSNWHDRNRLGNSSVWFEDADILSIPSTIASPVYIVNDYNGQPQYAFEITDYCILPVKHLKRKGWGAARRVYFSPEKESIAIFFGPYNHKVAKKIVLTSNVFSTIHLKNDEIAIGSFSGGTSSIEHSDFSCLKNDEIAIGSFPGGTSSIEHSDFSCLKNKDVAVWVSSLTDRDEVEFAIKLVAKLRKNYQVHKIYLESNHGVDELPLEELKSTANQYGIAIPEELNESFLGHISSTKPERICDILNNNDVIHISIDENIDRNLAETHVISRIQRYIKNESLTVFIPNERIRDISNSWNITQNSLYYKFLDSKEQENSIKSFKYLMKDIAVVIFTSADLVRKSLDQALQYCANNGIAVVYITKEQTRSEYISQFSSYVKISAISGYKLAVTSLNRDWNYKLKQDDMQVGTEEIELTEEDIKQIQPKHCLPSRPLNFENL